MRPKRSCLLWNSDALWMFSACMFCRKGSGHNFLICASKNEAVCFEVQTHLGSLRLSSFIKKFWVHFPNLCVQKWSCLPLSSDAFGSSLPSSFTEKVLGAIPRFVRPKTKLIAVKFRCILEVLYLQHLQKKFWAQFHDLCVQNWNGLLWSSDASWKFAPFKFYKKILGTDFRLMRPKTKLFAVKFKRILEVLCLWVLLKKL